MRGQFHISVIRGQRIDIPISAAAEVSALLHTAEHDANVASAAKANEEDGKLRTRHEPEPGSRMTRHAMSSHAKTAKRATTLGTNSANTRSKRNSTAMTFQTLVVVNFKGIIPLGGVVGLQILPPYNAKATVRAFSTLPSLPLPSSSLALTLLESRARVHSRRLRCSTCWGTSSGHLLARFTSRPTSSDSSCSLTRPMAASFLGH